MSLYVLRYGTERGKGDYVGVGTPSRQVDAAKWAGRLAAVRARDESRKRGYDVRIVRLRPKRALIGYVVRVDGPGSPPTWESWSVGEATTNPRLRARVAEREYANELARTWRNRSRHARVVPVHLRVRP